MKILVAEDEPTSRRRLQAFLKKWGYDVELAVDGAEALEALARPNYPRLAILDWMLPLIDGLDVCRRVRAEARDSYVYIILLTAHGSMAKLLEGFDAGADDYIIKPFEARELQARVQTGARIVQLQEELLAAREELRVKATHDPLTGLLNRSAFFDAYARTIEQAKRRGTAVTLAMVDIDYFKPINDQHGHPAGDGVLMEAAARIAASVRAADVVGRYGGEEFVIAAPDCDVESAHLLAERLRASVSAAPVVVAATRLTVTCSVGVATGVDVADFDRLLRVADEALYRAKRQGRNRVVLERLDDAVRSEAS